MINRRNGRLSFLQVDCGALQLAAKPDTAGSKSLRYATYGSITDEVERQMLLLGHRGCGDEIHLISRRRLVADPQDRTR